MVYTDSPACNVSISYTRFEIRCDHGGRTISLAHFYLFSPPFQALGSIFPSLSSFKINMLLRFVLSIFCYSALAAALNSSTYYFAQEDTNITFTLSAAADTGDLFFRLSAPGSYDWVSIGIGSSMKNALTFITYPSKNGSCMSL